MEEREIILSRWLQGEVSDVQVKELFPDIDLDALRYTLSMQEKLDISVHKPESQWESLDAILPEKKKPIPTKRTIILFVLLALALFSAFWYGFSNTAKKLIKADSNEFLQYAFEDGSSIKLWPGSSMQYDASSYMEDRVIELDGEAFFEVEKGNTFRVETKAGHVEVLGTSFNVWEADRKNLEVKCFTGRVRVTDNASNNHIITAGEKVNIIDDELQDVATFDVVSHRNNSLKHYDKAKVKWIIEDLQNIYNTQISLSEGLQDRSFSGAVSIIDLNRALSYLCTTLQWEYEIKDQNVFIKNNN